MSRTQQRRSETWEGRSTSAWEWPIATGVRSGQRFSVLGGRCSLHRGAVAEIHCFPWLPGSTAQSVPITVASAWEALRAVC